MYYKKSSLGVVFLFLLLFGCVTLKEYQADLIVGQTTKADLLKMLGTPSTIFPLNNNLWSYQFRSGKRANIRIVQADGTELQYVLGTSGFAQVWVTMNSKTNILESVSVDVM